MRLFTIGYEKRGIDHFINILRENEIEVLVDIRAVPHSRNSSYAKRNLENRLSENGIDYLLKKELGSSKELRDKVKADGDYDYFFREYDKAETNRCHRSSVAKKLEWMDNNLEIVNL
jgi:uncharacterized protein (DUF488 family)